MAYGPSAARSVRHDKLTNLLKVLTREAVRFCSRAVRLFAAPLAQMRTVSYGTFINGFAKKAFTGPYGSYDNIRNVLHNEAINQSTTVYLTPEKLDHSNGKSQNNFLQCY